MRKLLILTDAFAPPLWAPRVRHLAANLQKRGWQVSVFAEELKEFSFKAPNTNFHFFCFYKKNNVFYLLRWLIEQIFLTKERYFQAFIEKKADIKAFDAILCSTYSLFPMLAAYRLAQRYNKPLLVDLRDITEQWGTSATVLLDRSKCSFLKKWFVGIYNRRNVRMRNMILRKADCVTSVSSWHIDVLKQFNPNISLIYNGFDNQFYPANIKTEQFIIVYTGKMLDLSMRNPEMLFDALKQLNNPQMQVHWYTNKGGQKIVAKIAEKYGVGAQMRYYDYVPNNEVPDLLRQSSVVLVLAAKETEKGPHGIMTTKFFEAVGVEKPILCVRSDEGCLAEAIKDVNAGLAAVSVDEVVAFLQEKYDEFLSNGFTHQAVNKKVKAQFSREKQAEAFEVLLNQIIPQS